MTAATATTDLVAFAVADIVERYGIDAGGLTEAEVLSLGFDAACEDEDETRAAAYDALIALAK